MRFVFLFFCFFCFFCFSCFSCSDGGIDFPDLSEVDLGGRVEVLRFDRDLFSISPEVSRDSLVRHCEFLACKYPWFWRYYVGRVLGLGSVGDSSGLGLEFLLQFRGFLRSYDSIYRKVAVDFGDLGSFELELARAFKYLKFYFPSYPLPRVVSFVSPLDAVFSSGFGLTPDILGDTMVGVSLLLHDSRALVTSDNRSLLMGVHESYIVPRFVPETMVSSVMKNIVEDLYPDRSVGGTLLEQMLERGKRYYLLHRLLPDCADSLLFYYSSRQLRGCLANEASIWQRVKSLDVLYKRDNYIVRSYLGDSPFTPSLSQESPGNIGAWLGYRIVQSYMSRHSGVSLDELMALPADKLFVLAKYRPRNVKLR